MRGPQSRSPGVIEPEINSLALVIYTSNRPDSLSLVGPIDDEYTVTWLQVNAITL